jgi:hypothetical protein
MMRAKYVGSIDNKSIMPKKLKMYFEGLFDENIRAKYSIVNSIVIIHSAL